MRRSSIATPSSKHDPKRNRGGVRGLFQAVRFLARYPGQVAVSLVLLLLIIALDLSIPAILGHSINGLRDHATRGAAWEPSIFVRLLLAVVLARAGLAVLLGPIRNRLIQQALADVRQALYDALQRLAFSYHDRSSTGELVSRSTTDVMRLQDFFFACLFLSVDVAVSITLTMVLVFRLNVPLGCVAVGTMAPTIALVGYFAARLQPQWRKVHDLHGAMATVIQENIAGVRVVKAFAREQSEIGKFRARKDDFQQTLLNTVHYWAFRIPLAQFLFGLGVPLALALGGRQVVRGELAVGDLAQVVFYFMAIGHRVALAGQVTSIIQNASASAERIFEILREPRTLRSGTRPLPTGRGGVRFETVGFDYQSDRASLTDVSFEALPGQTVAIVGPTGSGKSTLVNLIPRFYDVSTGRVLVDGVDVRELDLHSLRRSVAVIFQESFLFSTTVAGNIAYGRPGATQEDIERCARAAHAHEFITELEDGYHTIVGERGITLSGGQKQRVAIARAFLTDPRILIFDDATASVDAATERLIREAVRELCRDRTTFVIAHRAATVRDAHQILVLEGGRIVERGRHDELLRAGGVYSAIFARQIHE